MIEAEQNLVSKIFLVQNVLWFFKVIKDLNWRMDTARKVSKYGVISGPYFPVSVFGYFSRSGIFQLQVLFRFNIHYIFLSEVVVRGFSVKAVAGKKFTKFTGKQM